MNEMSVVDETGDTKIIWDADNEDEVNNARKTFDNLRAKGFTAFSVKRDGTGKKDTLITSFDKNLESIIMVPRMAGG